MLVVTNRIVRLKEIRNLTTSRAPKRFSALMYSRCCSGHAFKESPLFSRIATNKVRAEFSKVSRSV